MIRALLISWRIATATLHRFWALRRLNLLCISAQEALPVLMNFHWRSGERARGMRGSARISLHLRRASSGQEFRIPGRRWVGCAQLRSEDFPPSTSAHFVILFILFMFILQSNLLQIDLFLRGKSSCLFFVLHASDVGTEPQPCTGCLLYAIWLPTTTDLDSASTGMDTFRASHSHREGALLGLSQSNIPWQETQLYQRDGWRIGKDSGIQR